MSADEHGEDIPQQQLPNGSTLDFHNLSRPGLGRFTEHEKEMLIRLAEEAGEVIQAVTKMLLFGPRAVNGSKHYDNGRDLGLELGDLHHMTEVCYSLGLFPADAVQDGIKRKEERLGKYQRTEAP